MEPADPRHQRRDGRQPAHPDEPAAPVAVLVVPTDTAGAYSIGEPAEAGHSAVLVHSLVQPDRLDQADPRQIQRPTEDRRAAALLALSRGADYLRVWDRAREEVVATLISDTPFNAAVLSPDGVLLVATKHGAKALRIRPRAAELASLIYVPYVPTASKEFPS